MKKLYITVQSKPDQTQEAHSAIEEKISTNTHHILAKKLYGTDQTLLGQTVKEMNISSQQDNVLPILMKKL